MGTLVNSEYSIWASDHVVYGPIDLTLLNIWVKEGRVTPATWIYVHAEAKWRHANQLPELEDAFPAVTEDGTTIMKRQTTPSYTAEFSPAEMRRIKLFGSMSDAQILRLGRFLELHHFRGFTEIAHQGDPGDAMFFILDGEVRVRILVGGKETTIATLGKGEFFGEISLFDHGPRSADVVANEDVSLLKLTTASFQKLIVTAPELAAPFLVAMGRTLTARIRADNKRLRDSVALSRGAAEVSF